MMSQILKNLKGIHQLFAIEKENTELDSISTMKQSYLQPSIPATKFITDFHNNSKYWKAIV
jgi:hypothetical protein